MGILAPPRLRIVDRRVDAVLQRVRVPLAVGRAGGHLRRHQLLRVEVGLLRRDLRTPLAQVNAGSAAQSLSLQLDVSASSLAAARFTSVRVLVVALFSHYRFPASDQCWYMRHCC